MRILLIAYEFPPSPSPQSLRWTYLAGRLAMLGHEVHVMAPDIAGSSLGLPDLPASVRVHRVYPGPVRAVLARLAARRPLPTPPATGVAAADGDADMAGTTASHPPVLNWKGRLLVQLQRAISLVRFPDLRGEWLRPAANRLPHILEMVAPDVVVSSHEPATTLQVGLEAAARYPWVADLGDPVLAAYTPRRWRSRAWRLECETLRTAAHVIVTTARARDLLCERHGTPPEKLSVVGQGFDEERASMAPLAPPMEQEPTRLMYAGSFYSFRDPTALVDAVLSVPGVLLEIASGNVPAPVAALAKRHPGQLRLLGHVSHTSLLDLQRHTHVLVNLANQDASQVPGKFYEYFGACRPILHLQSDVGDATGQLLARLRRGWSSAGDTASIAAALKRIRALHLAGSLENGLDLSPQAVAPWSWMAAACAVSRVLEDVVRPASAEATS